MAEPLDAVKAIHNAFRHDMDGIDGAWITVVLGTWAMA
jgi:hypothetical protein